MAQPTAEKGVPKPTTLEEYKALIAKLSAAEGAADAKGAFGKQLANGTWTDCMMGLAKSAVMNFNDIVVVGDDDNPYTPIGTGPVADAYLEPLGITWANTLRQFLPPSFEDYPKFSDGPSPPWVAIFGRSSNNLGVDGSFTSNDGLIEKVSFYYATLSAGFIAELQKTFPELKVANPTVSAWTGPSGTGKKLATKTLPWTDGEFVLNFDKVDIEFKGVAKSISFTTVDWPANSLIPPLFVDNVEITTPAGKAKILAAGALEVEEKAVEIENELKVLLNVTHKI